MTNNETSINDQDGGESGFCWGCDNVATSDSGFCCSCQVGVDEEIAAEADLIEAEEIIAADARIDALKPGQSIELTSNGDIVVSAERSGDGKTLRIVRSTPKGFDVIKTESFRAVSR